MLLVLNLTGRKAFSCTTLSASSILVELHASKYGIYLCYSILKNSYLCSGRIFASFQKKYYRILQSKSFMFLGILIEPCYGNHERCKSKTEAGVENHHFSQKRLKNLLDCAVFDLYRYLFFFVFFYLQPTEALCFLHYLYSIPV